MFLVSLGCLSVCLSVCICLLVDITQTVMKGLVIITYVLCVCVCPGEGNVGFNATPNPFHLNKICLNQRIGMKFYGRVLGGTIKN